MKNKKKVLVAVLVIAAVVCIALVGGTIAYVTNDVQVVNAVSTGKVDITLQEKCMKGGLLYDFEDVDCILPGQSVSKIVRVKNDGTNTAWVRVSVTPEIRLREDKKGKPDLSLLSIDYNDEDWTWGEDGYWYYNEPLKPGATTENLFTRISFSNDMDNLYQGCDAKVEDYVQAVQWANNGSSALDAAGWPRK